MSSGGLSFLVFVATALVAALGLTAVSAWRRSSRDSRQRTTPPRRVKIDPSRPRFPFRPYLSVLVFVCLQATVAVLCIWAIDFRRHLQEGRLLAIEPLAFVAIVGVGLIYVWRKGGFPWK